MPQMSTLPTSPWRTYWPWSSVSNHESPEIPNICWIVGMPLELHHLWVQYPWTLGDVGMYTAGEGLKKGLASH